jgi:hypothetical protein
MYEGTGAVNDIVDDPTSGELITGSGGTGGLTDAIVSTPGSVSDRPLE